MGGDNAVDVLELARELEERDADVAARLDSVESLLRQIDELQARAGAIRAALAALPDQVRHAEQAAATARERRAAAAMELAEAEHRHEEVVRSRRSSDEAREAAERTLRRTRVAVGDAEQTVNRTDQELEDLVAVESALRAEGEGVEVEVGTLAPVVATVPRISDSGRTRPGATLDGVVEWAARAHAALFVVRGSLVSERERVVVEAGGLAAAVLGEDVTGTSVALVRRRLEKELAGGGPASD